MAKQFGNMWLSRDKGSGNYYNISKNRPAVMSCDDRTKITWGADRLVELSPALFHGLTDVRLKPGEGPMRAQISIEI